MKNCPLRVTCILLNRGQCRQPDTETCRDGTALIFSPFGLFFPCSVIRQLWNLWNQLLWWQWRKRMSVCFRVPDSAGTTSKLWLEWHLRWDNESFFWNCALRIFPCVPEFTQSSLTWHSLKCSKHHQGNYLDKEMRRDTFARWGEILFLSLPLL